MFVLDTNIVSELRRPRPHGAVLAWLGSVQVADLHICAYTLGELQAEVELTRARDPAKAAALDRWIDLVPGQFHVLAMDGPIFRAWARLMHGRSETLEDDAMIAAAALVHGMTVVTRNVRDFEALGARVMNPFVWGE